MPRIKSFPTDSTINDNDKLIGTDSQTGDTKNYKVGDLKDHIKSARLHIHHQNNASTTWVINHNLNKFPSVSVVDSANTTVEGGIQYNNQNTLTLTFSASFSGKAYLN